MGKELSIDEKLTVVGKVLDKVHAKSFSYQNFADLLEYVLAFHFGSAQISARTKTEASIAGKILKKYIGYRDPDKIFAKLTDLVGARMIFLRDDEAEHAASRIRDIFQVNDLDSEDKLNRLGESQFGYRSIHYVIRCDTRWFKSIGAQFPYGTPIHNTAAILSEGGMTFTAELQVRSWLQHVWADLYHDSIYKGDREIPAPLLREWNSLSAIFENVDNEIVRFFRELDRHNENSGMYYIAGEVEKKIADLTVIVRILKDSLRNKNKSPQQFQAEKTTLKNDLLELWRLYNILGWNRDEQHVSDFKKLLDNDAASARDYEEIRNKVLIASNAEFSIPPPYDGLSADDLLELAVRRGDPKLYEEALKKVPDHPKFILHYLFSREKIDCDVLLCSLLNQGLEKCRRMIDSSRELPWAFAGRAFFTLVKMNAGFTLINKENIEVIHDSLLRLIDLCNNRSVSGLAEEKHVATTLSRNVLKLLTENFTRQKLSDTGLIFQSPNGEAPLFNSIELLLRLGCHAHGIILMPPRKTDPEISPEHNVVVLFGGCGTLKEYREELNDFKELIKAALRRGTQKFTFQTGAGKEGICSLDEELSGNTVIRYGVKGDTNATVKSEYSKHSIFEALLGWRHLAESGVRFDDTCLVGFGLGPLKISSTNYLGGIAYLECKMALAFGARVTVIGHRNFNECYRAFEQVPFWSSHPGLVRLPKISGSEPANNSFADNRQFNVAEYLKYSECDFPEPAMLRVFMLFKVYREKDYQDAAADELVKKIHWIKELRSGKKRMKELGDKDSDKCSILHRRKFFEVLKEDCNLAGFLDGEISKAKGGNFLSDSPDIVNYRFAELEHARWFVERWLRGTRYGKDKIVNGVIREEDKRNPCMIAWFDLDEETARQDLDFLNRYVVASAADYNQVKTLFEAKLKEKNEK